LIRDVADRGVLMLCDPRLLSKSYGKVFLNSLPALPRTRNCDDVAAFFDAPVRDDVAIGDVTAGAPT
jgi:ATP-dependent DNA helicase DinG